MLGGDAVLLARIIEWCEAKDHVGVRGEASRLLAALIRHSRNPVSLREHKNILPFFVDICLTAASSLTGSGSCSGQRRWDTTTDLHGNE